MEVTGGPPTFVLLLRCFLLLVVVTSGNLSALNDREPLNSDRVREMLPRTRRQACWVFAQHRFWGVDQFL